MRVALVALAVGAWLVVGASSASAAAVTCGQTITQDTTVDNDLSNCPGDGLVVGADNITLDLNGHTVSGPGATPTFTAGVRVTGRSGVTVRNGTVAQFDREVSVEGSANRVLLLTLGAGPQGSVGVVVAGGQGNTVAFNRLPSGFPPGIDLEGSSGNEVAFNVGPGRIEANVDADDNRIEHNQVAGVGGFHSDRNHISYNTLRFVGVSMSSFDWSIDHNTVLGGSISLDASSRFVVYKNLVLGSPYSGISVTERFHEGETVGNVLLGNTVARSAANGIFIQGPTGPGESRGAVNTLIRHNKTRRNGNDGIHTDAPTTTLTKNIANFNTNVGINAPAGAIDGGGNHAHGNGLAQCINIACSP